MRVSLRLALDITTNDIVYDICGRKLKVSDYSVEYITGEPINVTFYCYDSDGNKEKYSYEDLYLNFDDIDDAENCFIEFVRRNPDLVFFNHDKINFAREIFMQGFSDGFQNKLKYSADEQLQK